MKKKFIKSFIISSLVFVLIFVGIGKMFSPGSGSLGFTKGEDVMEDDENKPEQKIDNEVVFLLMGVDAKDVKDSKGTRTDTLMLMKANFETGDIGILSLPRDTRVLVKGEEDKLNHAHAYGGPRLTMETVRDFTNIDVDYYVKMDYRAVEGIVDAIGGVEIDVPINMSYSDPVADPPLNIQIDKGLQTLDGKDAHNYLRFRSGYPDGDLGRINAQQIFMKELMKQTIKPKNILKLPKIIETYYDYVETNIPMNVILKGAVSANNMDVDNMRTNTIPGTNEKIGGLDYLIYNRDETDIIIQDMFNDYVESL